MSKYGNTRNNFKNNYTTRNDSNETQKKLFRGLIIDDSSSDNNNSDNQGIFRLTSPSKKDT